jgi:hypothetical protein
MPRVKQGSGSRFATPPLGRNDGGKLVVIVMAVEQHGAMVGQAGWRRDLAGEDRRIKHAEHPVGLPFAKRCRFIGLVTACHDDFNEQTVFPGLFLNPFHGDGRKRTGRDLVEHQADHALACRFGRPAAVRGRYPSACTASMTRRLVSALMRISSCPFRTKDTVDCDTPAWIATSFIVARGRT